ncbi:uncharacterized protein LOC111289397 isoform X2 [Durio zibethinus]|uniref:Uncharacterized protein LOC111289397 isoform X2 n=1 Tax=Durio zibethinus TaxID=66656 RepID=A0A6P5Y6U5_DURZI|nr:uncharacterized protein LOC111289397 isoform X2 [Durio zibethinus]
MDYDDNDFQSQNLHLAGEGNNKFPPVPYSLPRFDFDDNLHGQLRFDSLAETEVFLGIESSEDNQWIEDFSRGSTGIAFSSSAAEPCSISRGNNVWSEAASSESVEMLLKSVGQEETIPCQTITKDSDACDELGCIIYQMEPSLKHEDSALSKVGDNLQPTLQTGEVPVKFSGLEVDVGGDHRLVEDVSQTLEFVPSVDGVFKDPNTRNSDLPVTQRDKSKDGEQVVDDNLVEASTGQSVDNREQDNFASGSQVDTVIPAVRNTSASSALIASQDTTHLKNDVIDENVDSLERENVDLSQAVHIDAENLIENAVASITSQAQKQSPLDMQPKEGGRAIGNSTATVGEPFDGILKGKSDLHTVEGCSEGLGLEIPLQTGISKDIVLCEGNLHDISPMPFDGNTNLKEHEVEISNTDIRICTSLESKMESMVHVACDAVEKKNLTGSVCHPDMKILSSKSEKSLLLAEDGKSFKDEGEGASNTLEAETVRVCEEYIVTERHDDYKCDQSVSAAAKQNTKLPSDCSNTVCGYDRSPLVIKGVDSSSFAMGGTVNELASNLQSDVAVSGKSMDCVPLPFGKGLPVDAVFDQKEVQVSSSEASFSIMKTSEAPCKTIGQFSSKKVDQSLSMEDTSNAEGQIGDQTLRRVTLEVVKDMQASSVVSDSTVRGTEGAEAQVISKRGSSEAAGAVSIQENIKTLTNSVPSTSKASSHDTDQNHLEDSDPKLVSEEKISDHVAVHVDGDHAKTRNSYLTSAPSSESQTKFHMMESGSNSADLGNPSSGSPIVIRTSEQSQSQIEKEGVKGSKDQSASASGVINGEVNKEQSISRDTKGNDISPGDRSFTFEVVEGTPSTSGISKMDAMPAQEACHANLQASERENVRGGSKGTSERKTRRAGAKSTRKEAAKKGSAAKEMTLARQSERSDRTSNVSLSSAGIGHLVQSNEMQHYGHMEVFHQPFIDLQQVQLRAQIFVYGALIQGTAPDEAYMISAFGGPDGGRTIWENAWRACIDRVHSQKSLVSPETPLQTRIGAKTSDQSTKQNAVQSKVTSSPASRSTSKVTPATIVNPMIPLSSPLWSIPTPSGEALQHTGILRGAVMDYQQALSPLHPPPTRNFVGHNAPWMSQSSFRGPWVPPTSAFDGNARFPVLPITETVNSTPVREASVAHSSGMKQVSTVPMVQSGSAANILAGAPLLDAKKATVTPGQRSGAPKPRKRKKSTVSEDLEQIILHAQTDSLSATVVTGHASEPAVIATPATIVSKSSTDTFITSVSADHLKKGYRDSDQRATQSEETLSRIKEAQKQAEDAAALAAAAVSHSQEIWNQFDKHKNSGLAPDVETKLTSAAVAIAAAAAVAKAAAAAANVASNAALQAKFMADEALVVYRNSIPTNTIASDSVKKLGKATPASILRGEDATTSSNSVIVAAREAARRRVEAASAASKRAENMDAIVKAAVLAAEAVSQAGKIVALGEPFPLTELVEAGREAYWKVRQGSPLHGAIREHIDKGGSVEDPGSSARLPKEVPEDKREKQSDSHGMSPTLREMARESMEDRSRSTDGILGPAATSGKDKKGQKGRKASDITKTKGVTAELEIGFGSPSMTTQTEHEKAGETSKDNNIREGSHVEVLRDGGNLKVAWFLADVLDLKDGKAYVCYNELRSEDGDRLKEWVQLEGEGDRAPRVRSARPIKAMPFEGTRKRRRAAMGEYNWSVGDRVDAWMQDSWWEGVVTEKSKKDETSFTVHFPAQGETSVVKAWLLRPSLMWANGSWVEWSSSQDNNGSTHEGDTPQEKRPRIGSPLVEAKGKDKHSKSVGIEESVKPDDMRLLDLSASEKIFNIGKSTGDDSKPDPLRMTRTGLKKEGSRVIFGVPKPGKKRKFMEVSKHYDVDQRSKTHETSDLSKFTKYFMPQASEPYGTKNKIEPKEKRMAVSKPKVLKSGKPPSVSSRTILQKDNLSNSVSSEPADAVAADVSKFKDSVSHAENTSGKHNMMEFGSFSSSDGAAEGPVLFSSVALPSDAPSKKTSTANAKSKRINKGKLAPGAGKLAKIEEKVFNSSKTVSEVVEPRRSNRRIQPTSRLLEGLQSSLIISKIPSVSHDKSHKSQSRSTRGNNQG